ncbi:hypothetical protein quinque_009754 [Culex quinquefasciatus]
MSAPLRTPVKRTPVKDVNNTKRQRQDDEHSPTIPAYTMSLNDAVRMLMNQFAAHKTLIDDMRTEINTKIDTVKNTLESKLDAVTTDIQSLRTECAVKFRDHDAALDALDGRIGDVAYFYTSRQYAKQLGLDERLSSMVDVKRLKAGTLSDGDNGLVLVQFALKNQRDNFYRTYLRKHNLQLSHLGIDSAHRVYVNENLTRAAQKLKAAAIRLKKAGKLFTVYTKLGVVYVRRVAGADPIVIVSEEQLNQLS